MRSADAAWPGFGLAEHKGYGTASHFAAISKLGASPFHRLTFAPLKNMFPKEAEAARGGPLDPKEAKAAKERKEREGKEGPVAAEAEPAPKPSAKKRARKAE